jgi:hypothetical protein
VIKTLILQLALSCWAATLFGQEFTAVQVSTTTPLRDALHICKNVGELEWFYSLDYDERTDSFSILLHPLGPTIKIEISASATDGKTTLALTLCEAQAGMLHTGVGGYMTRLKTFANGLKGRLENIVIGEYRKGKGLAIPRQIEPFGVNVKMTADSLYMVNFTDSLPDDKLRAQHWIVMGRGRGVLSYEGNLYFMVEYPNCVLLVKRNDTFYFHIPHSLPSLYYLNQAKEEEDLSVIPGGYSRSVADLAINTLDYLAHTARGKKLLKEGLTDQAHRDCYIDLDTGIIKNL